jgi:hypothetical protein
VKPGSAILAVGLTLGLILALPQTLLSQTLSIDITTIENEDYDRAVDLAIAAGAEATSLTLFWDDLETVPGVYAPETFDWPAIAADFYPDRDLPVTLTFSVIDTVTDRRPPDLRGLPWDDPLVIDRFARHLDEVLVRLQPVELIVIAIGNEVDGLLRTENEVAAFARFLDSARARVATDRPGIRIGTKLTFEAVRQAPDIYRPLLDESYAALLTYYPLAAEFSVRPVEDVSADLATMVAFAGDKPLYLMETGYPSGGCGGTPEAQAAFFETLLSETAGYGDDVVPLVSLTWLSDIPAGAAEVYGDYYGVNDACFLGYLETLGLRAGDGTPKPALDWLLAR